MQPKYQKRSKKLGWPSLFGHVGEPPADHVDHVPTPNPNYAHLNIPLEVAGRLPINWKEVFRFCKKRQDNPYVIKFLEPNALRLSRQFIPRFNAKAVYIPETHGVSVPEAIDFIQVRYGYTLGTPEQVTAWMAQRITNGEPNVLENTPPLIMKGDSDETITFHLGPPNNTPMTRDTKMPPMHFKCWSDAVKKASSFTKMQAKNFMSRFGFMKDFYCDPYETSVIHDGACFFLVKEF